MDNLEALVARHEPRLRRLAFGLLRDAGEAADMVQEVFLSAWRGPALPADERGREAWLVTLCLNRCRDRIRARTRERRRLESVVGNTGREEAPGERLEREEEHRVLLSTVDALPAREREAFLLMAVEGQSSEQAGAAMGCGPSAARMALMRARLAMADRLRNLPEFRGRT